MTRMIMRGRLTDTWARAFLEKPIDREAALRAMVESTGSKMIDFYFTTGDYDFLMVSESADPADSVAFAYAVKSKGAISDVSIAVAWTPAEFKIIGEKAARSTYALPGDK